MIAIVRVHKAEPIGHQNIPTTTIQVGLDNPLLVGINPPDDPPKIVDRIDFDFEARAIRDALVESLPGGTLDRLIVLLLETRTSQLIVRR